MIQRPAIDDWIEVTSPPKPYLHAVRRSFPSGLHVLVLARQAAGNFHVLSSVDHGTRRGTRLAEGIAPTAEGVADLIARACEKWNAAETARTVVTAPRLTRYHYAKPTGGVSDAVSRDALFDLVSQGGISWEAQVWADTGDPFNSGVWRPITASLGFPQDDDIIADSDR